MTIADVVELPEWTPGDLQETVIAGFQRSAMADTRRAGFVTQAVRGGANTGSIMLQTGHRSHAMVVLYRRENAPLINNAVTSLGR